MIAALDDDAPRLVWADREGGARGELVVVQCELARADLSRAERKRLRDRERFLLRAVRYDRLAGLADEHRLARGFVEHVRLPLATLAARAGELFERAPCVRSIAIDATTYVSARDNRGQVKVLDDLLALHARAYGALPTERVRALRTSSTRSDTEDVTRMFAGELVSALTRAPALARLESLAIFGAPLAPEALAVLRSLVRLEGAFDPAAALRALPALSRCALDPEQHDRALAELLAAPEAKRLVELDLTDNGVRIADVRRIAASPALARLERLCLDEGFDYRRSRLPRETIVTIARSPHLGALVELHVRCQALDAVSLAALAAAPFAPRLRALSVARCEDDVAARALIDAFPSLVSLYVREPPDDVDELRAVIPDVAP